MLTIKRPVPDDGADEWPGREGLVQTNIECDFGEVITLDVDGRELRLWVNFASFDGATPCHVRVLTEGDAKLNVASADVEA